MRTTLILLTCLLFSGCFPRYVVVETPWPTIRYPVRPAIEIPEDVDPEDPKVAPFIRSTYIYSRHIDALERVIETYNAEADRHNELSGAALR